MYTIMLMIISKMLNALILSLHILNVVNSFSISLKWQGHLPGGVQRICHPPQTLGW
ncbi:hypothetical protein SRABI96_05218 [Peribacillus sp. Bi96]|nr:hypothetical protein SRABI96_05218 [Peribacillus sp. Bi96]